MGLCFRVVQSNVKSWLWTLLNEVMGPKILIVPMYFHHRTRQHVGTMRITVLISTGADGSVLEMCKLRSQGSVRLPAFPVCCETDSVMRGLLPINKFLLDHPGLLDTFLFWLHLRDVFLDIIAAFKKYDYGFSLRITNHFRNSHRK